jgi:hypothetical protein
MQYDANFPPNNCSKLNSQYGASAPVLSPDRIIDNDEWKEWLKE